jgi:hypothetical protein
VRIIVSGDLPKQIGIIYLNQIGDIYRHDTIKRHII